jgi:hypothetical protein
MDGHNITWGHCEQGDQIGRSFAHWVIVYVRKLGKILIITQVAHIFGHFSAEKVWCSNFDKKCVGLHFWAIFYGLVWSPCLRDNFPFWRRKRLFAIGNERKGSAAPPRPRVARWHIFKQKIQIWVNFGGSSSGRCWYILWPFGLFTAICYIFWI